MIYVRQSTKVSNNGIGFLGACFLVLLVLKLIGFFPFSWWLVTLPLWIVPAILLGLGVLAGLIWLLTVSWSAHRKERLRKSRTITGS